MNDIKQGKKQNEFVNMQDNYVNIWPVYFDDQMRHGYTNMLLLLTCDLLMSCDLLYVQIMLLQY